MIVFEFCSNTSLSFPVPLPAAAACADQDDDAENTRTAASIAKLNFLNIFLSFYMYSRKIDNAQHHIDAKPGKKLHHSRQFEFAIHGKAQNSLFPPPLPQKQNEKRPLYTTFTHGVKGPFILTAG
ncbi:hypothetical protein [Paenibacillus protaetiae]|uniref:hypothetical protein n=1 Tax=Paenibacillus protaetiae TaxID=2509456 RepID=UPI0013EDEE18|nr:hypothetical protein [Paenibacillus protaetiae]